MLKLSSNFLIKELESYVNNRFGSMTKSDFETLIFASILKNSDLAHLSNYQLSRELKISEAKIKKLKYECDLKYENKTTTEYNREKFSQLNKLLENVLFKASNNRIEFIIEDPSLRKFLENLLKQHNRYSDTSFNTEIVKINLSDLELILSSSCENKRIIKEIINKAEKELKTKITSKEIICALVQGASSGLTGGLINISPLNFANLFDSARSFIIKK